jgi:PTS system mannose-specific IIC component
MIFGDVKAGLTIGMVLELLWLAKQPLGTSLPPDDTIVAVAAPAGAILAGKELDISGIPLISFAVMIALPLSAIGKLVDAELRRINNILLKRARVAARAGKIEETARQNIVGLSSFFLFFTLFTLLGILSVWMLTILLYPYMPAGGYRALEYIFWSLPFFGVGAMLGREGGAVVFGLVYAAAYSLLFLVGRVG